MINFDPASGRACGAFGKWHLTYNTGDDLHPNNNGYARFAGCMSNSLGTGNGTGHFDWRRLFDGRSRLVTAPPFDETQWIASVNRRDALEWIGEQSGPWFAYVAFNPPHAPYTVPPFSLLSTPTQNELTASGLASGDVPGPSAPIGTRLLVY